MKLVNLTPHDVVLRLTNGTNGNGGPVDITIKNTGLARVTTKSEEVEYLGVPVPVIRNRMGEIEGLPPPEEGTVYIVSLIVLAQTKRTDVLAPATGPKDGAIRDAEGKVLAVTKLVAANLV